MGWIGCVCCEKFRRDFVARTFAPVRPVLQRVSYGNQMVPNATKLYEMQRNMSLGFNGVDRVCLLRKIPTRLRGTNFCTSLARFASSFVRQPNSPECTQIVRTHQNISLGSNGVDRVCSLQKIPSRLRGTNFCTSSSRFAPSFEKQPNGPECTQIVRNAPKCQFRVQWGGSGAFVAKYSDATSWYELLHKFGPFCTEFRKARNGPERTQIVRNAPKRQFRVQWGGSGAFVAKNSNATSWHELLH